MIRVPQLEIHVFICTSLFTSFRNLTSLSRLTLKICVYTAWHDLEDCQLPN